MSLRSGVTGAYCGALVWLVYGLWECAFAASSRWLIPAVTGEAWLHFEMLARSFGSYASLGALIGSVAGLALSADDDSAAQSRQRIQVLVLASVCLACAANLLLGADVSISSGLGAAMCVALAFAFGVRASKLGGRLAFLANAWSAAPILLGLTALFEGRFVESQGPLLLAVAVVSLLVAVAAATRIVRAACQRSYASLPTGAGDFLEALAIGVAVIVALSLAYRPATLNASISGEPQDPLMPNVLLVSLDTVGAEHLSVYGYARSTTPELESFARGATLYRNAIATSPWTLPSHASIFTGLYPRRHGAHFSPPQHPEGRPLSSESTTLAELLLASGYATAAVVSNFGALGRGFQLDQGFQLYDDQRRVRFLHSPFLREALLSTFSKRFREAAFDKETLTAEEINESARRVLGRLATGGERFLFFVNYMDAHTPYLPPPPFDERFEGRDPDFSEGEYWEALQAVMKLERPLDDGERDHLVSQYDGAIAYLDLHLGLLFEHLRDLDLYEDALIIVTSDHGEGFGDHMLMGHATSVHQQEVHIPLLIKYPRQTQARVVDEAVSLIDLFPTVLAAIGRSAPEPLPGADLQAGGEKTRIVISESYPNPGRVRWHPRFRRVERAIVERSLKLVQNSSRKPRLYDLSSDPEERIDRASELPQQAARLQSLLDTWLATTRESKPVGAELDAATREELRALGYGD